MYNVCILRFSASGRVDGSLSWLFPETDEYEDIIIQILWDSAKKKKKKDGSKREDSSNTSVPQEIRKDPK